MLDSRWFDVLFNYGAVASALVIYTVGMIQTNNLKVGVIADVMVINYVLANFLKGTFGGALVSVNRTAEREGFGYRFKTPWMLLGFYFDILLAGILTGFVALILTAPPFVSPQELVELTGIAIVVLFFGFRKYLRDSANKNSTRHVRARIMFDRDKAILVTLNATWGIVFIIGAWLVMDGLNIASLSNGITDNNLRLSSLGLAWAIGSTGTGISALGAAQIYSSWDSFRFHKKLDRLLDTANKTSPMAKDASEESNPQTPVIDPARDRLIFDLVNQRQSQEIQRTSDMDAKANNLVGFVTGITGVILGVTSLNLTQIRTLPFTTSIVLFAGIAFLFSALVAGLFAQKVRRWQLVPDTRSLVANYRDSSLTEVTQRVAGEMAKVVAELEPKNNSKAEWVERGWYLSVIGLSIIFLYIVVVLA